MIIVHHFTYRLTAREFNSYGSRRGNDAIMARGTFANIRLVNKFIGKAAPKTIHIPSGEAVSYKYYTITLLLVHTIAIHDKLLNCNIS